MLAGWLAGWDLPAWDFPVKKKTTDFRKIMVLACKTPWFCIFNYGKTMKTPGFSLRSYSEAWFYNELAAQKLKRDVFLMISGSWKCIFIVFYKSKQWFSWNPSFFVFNWKVSSWEVPASLSAIQPASESVSQPVSHSQAI